MTVANSFVALLPPPEIKNTNDSADFAPTFAGSNLEEIANDDPATTT